MAKKTQTDPIIWIPTVTLIEDGYISPLEQLASELIKQKAAVPNFARQVMALINDPPWSGDAETAIMDIHKLCQSVIDEAGRD